MTIYTSLQSPVNHVPLGSLAGTIAAGTPSSLRGHCQRNSEPPGARTLRGRH